MRLQIDNFHDSATALNIATDQLSKLIKALNNAMDYDRKKGGLAYKFLSGTQVGVMASFIDWVGPSLPLIFFCIDSKTLKALYGIYCEESLQDAVQNAASSTKWECFCQ
jgi:hypothetical protein